jgi:hypothetical protein
MGLGIISGTLKGRNVFSEAAFGLEMSKIQVYIIAALKREGSSGEMCKM